jgi:hypothetical protein
MKRIAGTCVLLAGLSGCISFTAQPGTAEKRTPETVACMAATPVSTVAMTPPASVTTPTNPNWTAHPEHQLPPAQYAARPASPYAPQPRPATPPVMTRPGSANALALATPAVPTGFAQPPAPLPAGIPMVSTPRNEPAPERQVGYTTTAVGAERVVPASRVEKAEPKKPRPMPALPPSLAAKGSLPVEPKTPETRTAKGGMPLMRMVNTKRITLNFEVKDVGPSGLSSVELWYTQDCRDWKKYDAPTQAQAYVIEVDEEGMYGFTLLARSGLGLGKEPPAPGEQPQVWVVVDLTRPDVQLTEVTPSASGRSQQVTLCWRASDKNLGRQPITIYYAEKEEGPWKTIASNLENTGKYVWQVPPGVARVHFKVEATDLAGNVGKAQWSKPVLLDTSMPTVSITAVDSAP